MGIDPNIRQFRASGVYRLLIDNSRIPDLPVDETLRLVVGFSKNGPFNTVVFVPDAEYFTSVFGERDRTLERQGSWFHLTALISLVEGPIYCLNLLNLNDELDLVDYKGFSLSPSENNDPLLQESYSNFYNKDKFYFPSDVEFIKITQENSLQPKLFNLVNLNKIPITVLVKKSNITGFDITAQEWYGNDVDVIPEFINPIDYISDYMIEVIVLKGDFTNFNNLKNDLVYGEYFTDQGLIKESLEEFLLLPEVTVIDRYEGCLIPDFLDKLGNPLFIETLINQDTTRTGLFCAIDQTRMDKEYLSGIGIDLLGHSIEKSEPESIEFLSYKDTLKETISELEVSNPTSAIEVEPYLNSELIQRITFDPYDVFIGNIATWTDPGTISDNDIVITVNAGVVTAHVWDSSTSLFDETFLLNSGDTIFDGTDYKVVVDTDGVFSLEDSSIKNSIRLVNYTDINSVVINNAEIRIGRNSSLATSITELTSWYYKRSIDGKFIQPFFLDQQSNDDFYILRFSESIDISNYYQLYIQKAVNYLEFINPPLITDSDYYILGEDHPFYKLWFNGEITSGDKFVNGNFVYFIEELEPNFIKIDGSFAKRLIVESYEEEQLITKNDVPALAVVTDSKGVVGNGTSIVSINGDLNRSVEVLGYLEATDKTKVIVDNTNGIFAGSGKLVVGNLVVSNFGFINGENSRLTRIVSITPNPNNVDQLIITALEDIAINEKGSKKYIERYKAIEDFVRYYVPTKLNGFRLRPEHLPNNTNQRMNEILEPLRSGGVYEALTDKESIRFRYIVDTFNHGIEPKSKNVYAKLCKKRGNIMALLNAPSWEEFKSSTNPSFRRAPTLETKQFPVETNFIVKGGNLERNPSIIYSLPDERDGGIYTAFYGPNIILKNRNKDISVPPAMFVGINFTRKFINSNAWSIVAGINRGVLEIPNYVGMEQNLNENDRALLENFGINPIIDKVGIGPTITSNSTAKQRTKSALSQIHAVDTVIYIQDGIADILERYVWEFNTPLVRRDILAEVDQFLLSVLNGGGITFFRNIMDESNNTPEIIQNNYAILDTEIEIVRGMGIIVHRTTVQRNNGVTSGGLV